MQITFKILSVVILYLLNLGLLIVSYRKTRDIFAKGFSSIVFLICFIIISIYTIFFVSDFITLGPSEYLIGYNLVYPIYLIVSTVILILQYNYIKKNNS